MVGLPKVHVAHALCAIVLAGFELLGGTRIVLFRRFNTHRNVPKVAIVVQNIDNLSNTLKEPKNFYVMFNYQNFHQSFLYREKSSL